MQLDTWSRRGARKRARRYLRAAGACLLAAALVVLLPARGASGAVGTPIGPPDLPDARAYEQVSSQQKNGNEAGINLRGTPIAGYASALPTGDGIAYFQLGPSGQTSSGTDLYSVSRRTPTGWVASAAVPPEYLANGDYLGQKPLVFLPSADLSRFLFAAVGPFTKENSLTFGDEDLGLYRTRGNSVEPEWLSKPTFPSFSEAKPEPGKIGIEGIYPVGGTPPDLSTVYFTYFGTLVSEDESRRPLVDPLPWNEATPYKKNEIVEEGGKHYIALTEEKTMENSKKEIIKEVNQDRKPSKLEGWWEVSTGGTEVKGPWGFYEWKEGALHSAGVLPENSPYYPNKPDPYGALPAATGTSLGTKEPFPRYLLNEVSQDGSKAFFVSPQPEHAKEAKTPTELYVREQTAGGPKTVLVSRDELEEREGEVTEKSKLLKGVSTENITSGVAVAGEKITAGTTVAKVLSATEVELSNPAAGAGSATVKEMLTFRGVPAPACVSECFLLNNPEGEWAVKPFRTKWAREAYVYGAPDGSRAFFVSRDILAKSAKGLSPEGSGPWTYEFKQKKPEEGGEVTYLPGVEGPIVTSSQDGSSFIFKNTTKHQIELWLGGPEPIPIASYPPEEHEAEEPKEPKIEVEGAATPGGTVFVFNTNAVLAHSPAFNNSAALSQSYRYDVKLKTLSCASCAPEGAPQGAVETNSSAHPRMIADEGARVFFGTTAKLLPQDKNEVADVYEWEKVGTGSCQTEEREGGCVYLISSGASRDPSFYLENDESGDNVFFSTSEGLVKGDSDESYDVYDARVNGGFPEEAPPTECESPCRRGGGAPPLATPLTTSLGPSGNLIAHPTPPPPAPKPKPKPLTRAQKLARALRACRHKPKKQRAACARRARAQYASRPAGHGHHRSRK